MPNTKHKQGCTRQCTEQNFQFTPQDVDYINKGTQGSHQSVSKVEASTRVSDNHWHLSPPRKYKQQTDMCTLY